MLLLICKADSTTHRLLVSGAENTGCISVYIQDNPLFFCLIIALISNACHIYCILLAFDEGLQNPTKLRCVVSRVVSYQENLTFLEYIYRGYYTAVRRHEFYLRVVKQYFTNERSE